MITSCPNCGYSLPLTEQRWPPYFCPECSFDLKPDIRPLTPSQRYRYRLGIVLAIPGFILLNVAARIVMLAITEPETSHAVLKFFLALASGAALSAISFSMYVKLGMIRRKQKLILAGPKPEEPPPTALRRIGGVLIVLVVFIAFRLFVYAGVTLLIFSFVHYAATLLLILFYTWLYLRRLRATPVGCETPTDDISEESW